MLDHLKGKCKNWGVQSAFGQRISIAIFYEEWRKQL